MNANTLEDNAATAAAWDEAFMKYAGIDPETYQVNIDTSITLSADGGDQYEVANRQKMAAMMHAGNIHAIVADTETFEGYARLEYFYDLTETFTEKKLTSQVNILHF